MIYWRFMAAGEVPTVAQEGVDAWLSPAERERLGRFAVRKRRDEWLLGRITAKAAVLEALCGRFGARPSPSLIEIVPTASGAPCVRLAGLARERAATAPVARLPLTVSISHSGGRALCAAMWSGSPRRTELGIDLEEVQPRSSGFRGDFLTPSEQEYCEAAPENERDLRANLVWSAKEAVVKALGCGLTVDTRDVECVPRHDGNGQRPALWPVDPGWLPIDIRCAPGLVAAGQFVRGFWRALPGFAAALSVLSGSAAPAKPHSDRLDLVEAIAG